MRIPSGVVDQYVYFVAVDVTDLATRETGLTGFTVYRSRNGGASTAFTTPTVAELSAADMPGVYSLLLDEDMTIDAGDDSQEMIFHINHASMAPIDRVIELYRPKATAGMTLTVESDGMGHADLKEWLGTAPLALASQLVQVSVGAIQAAVITATSIASDAFTAAKFASGAFDAVWTVATRTLTAASDSSGVTTLLTRLSAVRAGYLDNLSAGAAALESSLQGLITTVGAAGAGLTATATAVWAVATRLLTAGTNIVLAKGVGVTGFNDLSAAQVNTEADTALSDYGALKPTTAGRTLDVSAGGEADANVVQLNGDTDPVANLTRSANTMVRGTVDAGASTTSIPTSSLDPAAVDADQFKGRVVLFDRDTATTALRGQGTVISASDAGGTLTVAALTTAPANGDTFVIV